MIRGVDVQGRREAGESGCCWPGQSESQGKRRGHMKERRFLCGDSWENGDFRSLILICQPSHPGISEHQHQHQHHTIVDCSVGLISRNLSEFQNSVGEILL